MGFDERLHHAFDRLAERLHQELIAELTSVRAELTGVVNDEQGRAVAEAIRETQASAERELAQRVVEHQAAAEQAARTDAAALHGSASERLVAAIRSIDNAKSLSDILDTLVTAAAAEAGRAAMFLPQGTTLKGWRAAGFEPALDEAGSLELPCSDGGMIADACETGRIVRLDPGDDCDGRLPSFAGAPERCRAQAMPLVMTDQVFAVLYADEGSGEPAAHASWPATVEVLARHAARALEARTVTKLAQIAELVES